MIGRDALLLNITTKFNHSDLKEVSFLDITLNLQKFSFQISLGKAGKTTHW